MDLGQQKALERSGLQMFAALDHGPLLEVLGSELQCAAC